METAFDLMEGLLEDATVQQWVHHVESCSNCSAELDGWRQFKLALERKHLSNAPQAMLASAFNLFEIPAKPARSNSIRQLIATLTFDSFTQPAFAGARGQSATRQVVLRAEEFDIHVRIWVNNDRRELLGQVQPRGSKDFIESAKLHLLHNGERVSSADVNELGEFHFTFVPDGFLSLQIDLPNLTVIGALDVTDSN